MSETETRKSMDDVLASIRRIVRAERDPEAEDVTPATVDGDAEAGDMPLELTPDMMSEAEAAAAKGGSPAEFVSAPEPLDDNVFAPPPPAAAAAPAVQALDEDQIRDLVHEVVREELANGEGADLVREIIKAELTTGEIGGNISRNVLRLIRSEVAKAKG